MKNDACIRLEYLCDIIPALVSKIPETEFNFKPAPEKWSKKEILAHLIDSASNNHHRFIRSQFQNNPEITYEQNKWNKAGHYEIMDAKIIIPMWETFNRFLATLISLLSEQEMLLLCSTGGPEPHTLEWLFNDYVEHQEHHLKQILGTY